MYGKERIGEKKLQLIEILGRVLRPSRNAILFFKAVWDDWITVYGFNHAFQLG